MGAKFFIGPLMGSFTDQIAVEIAEPIGWNNHAGGNLLLHRQQPCPPRKMKNESRFNLQHGPLNVMGKYQFLLAAEIWCMGGQRGENLIRSGGRLHAVLEDGRHSFRGGIAQPPQAGKALAVARDLGDGAGVNT